MTCEAGPLCEPRALVLVPFPYADLSASKKRPVLVLAAPDRHGDFIGLAVTSVRTGTRAVRITASSLETGSLPRTNWIRVDKVFTLAEGIVARRFGTLSVDAMESVMERLCRSIGCHVDG